MLEVHPLFMWMSSSSGTSADGHPDVGETQSDVPMTHLAVAMAIRNTSVR